jgi:hypothetical protein
MEMVGHPIEGLEFCGRDAHRASSFPIYHGVLSTLGANGGADVDGLSITLAISG